MKKRIGLSVVLGLTADLCRAFARATMEGWKYCFDHHEEALDVVIKSMRELHLPTSRIH